MSFQRVDALPEYRHINCARFLCFCLSQRISADLFWSFDVHDLLYICRCMQLLVLWAGSCNFYRWNKLRGLPELLTLAQHYLLRTHSCTVRDRSTANSSFGPSVGCALQCTGAPYTASPPRLALGGPTFYLLQRTPPRTATRHLPSQPQYRRFHQRHICQVNRIPSLEELLALWAGRF